MTGWGKGTRPQVLGSTFRVKDKVSQRRYLDMKRWAIRSVLLGVVTLLGLLACGLQEVRSQEVTKPEVAELKIESRHVDIWSDGTRLSGDLWHL